MSLCGALHGAIRAKLCCLLGSFVLKSRLGVVLAGGTGFKLESNPDTVLAPDCSFISGPRGQRSEGYVEVAPDLAGEVRLPRENMTKFEARAGRWLRLGAKAIWLADPQERTIIAISANGGTRTLNRNEDLTGNSVIKGFRINVSEIFN